MKKLFLVALAAVGLASCVQNEELAVAGNSTAIAFGDSFVYNATKADPTTTTDSIDNFDVWAFMDEVGGTVLTDEDVTKSNGVWSYVNTQYWAPLHTYYFAALSPANSANVTETLATGDAAKLGLGEIAFTNVDGTEDLLYAKAKETTPDASTLAANGMDAVTMKFQHLLSKVKFTFQNGFTTNNMKVVVKNVRMSAPKSATIDLAQTDYAKDWVLGTEAIELAFGHVSAAAQLASGASASTDDTRLTIPASAAYEYTVTFNVEVFSGSVSAFKEENKKATIKGYELEMGKAYNFTAVINADSFGLHPIEFKAEVDPWDTEVNEPVGYIVENGNYVVASAAGLKSIAEGINNGTISNNVDVVLTGDIDLNTSRSFTSNWTPIGTSDKPFTGTFDGKGYTIKNLVINGGSSSNIGLFGFTTDGEIKNLVIENAKVSGRTCVGVVAGTPYTSKYSNITVKGHVEVNGMAYVGAVGGKNAYANWSDITVNVDETSYVNANSVENGKAYRTYVGGVIGFCGEGGHTFSNIYSNIDVKGSTIDVGGIVGIAHYGNNFVNCVCEGDVLLYATDEESAGECGGIAGVWHNENGTTVTLTNCSHTGTVKATSENGEVYFEGKKLIGSAYIATGTGTLVVNGLTPVSTADELVAALAAGKGVYLLNDITVAATKGGYDKAGILQNKAQTIDGGGNTLTVTGAGATWNCAIYTNGGTIKNLTVKGAMRGIFTAGLSADLHIENVEFKNVIYTFNSDGKTMPANPFGVYVSNSKVNGWTSHSNIHTEVVYTNCSFGEGSGYKYCRPYGKTAFVGCTFCAGYTLDRSQTTDITLTDCIFE